MYSGNTFTKYSGRLLGAHQKIDRAARENLAALMDHSISFPPAKEIIKFEGLNGPDGIKRKSPAKDEPWHYVDPFDDTDTDIFTIITEHHKELVTALKERNEIRAAFEAAWLAHALVDGLTPAHHYPYEKELAELRGGAGLETRTTIKEKLIMPGETKRHALSNNWKMWGPHGLFATHMSFEVGVASLIAPMSFKKYVPTKAEVQILNSLGLIGLFKQAAREVASLDLFSLYANRGWTVQVAHEVRGQLLPAIVKVVTLAWYSAAAEAELVKKPL